MDVIGSVVLHKAWGEGIIASVDGSHVRVDYPKVGTKVLQYPGAF